jgi:hypothetical protein
MEQRVNFVTVATPDLDTARRFYVDGLGWTTTLDVPGEILFFQIGPGIMLGLRRRRSSAVAVTRISPTPTGSSGRLRTIPAGGSTNPEAYR